MANEALPLRATSNLSEVHAFWNTEPCGAHFVEKVDGERATFATYRRFRYRTEWHIPAFAGFADARGKRVLEIGCGNGADAVMFALHGARYVGVDLTEKAVDATRRHLAAEGLTGQCRLANVERLGYPDASFDIVYSFGVLHHTRSPEQAMKEVWRVLKPGGVALVMLYHRHSFNYYVRILLYMRVRLLFEILRRSVLAAGTVERAGRAPSGLRGNVSSKIWDVHYENFRARGWSYLKAREFVHHCTDGPECPYAYTYSRNEVAGLFRDFTTIRTSVAHFPLNKYRFGRLVPRSAERVLGAVLGWHLQVRAIK